MEDKDFTLPNIPKLDVNSTAPSVREAFGIDGKRVTKLIQHCFGLAFKTI